MSNNFEKLEVNILRKNKFVDVEIVDIKNKKSFKLDEFTYNIDSNRIYLIPCKVGFMPTSFYIENHKQPLNFIDKNKGIPSRALNLLWEPSLYEELVSFEDDRTNLIIIILMIVSLFLNGIMLYFKLGG